MRFRVKLSNLVNNELILGHFSFFLNPLIVLSSQLSELLKLVNVLLVLVSVITHFQRLGPALLVQIHQHFLLKLILSVVNCHAVVVLVKAVLQRSHVRLLQVTDIRCRLARLRTGLHR